MSQIWSLLVFLLFVSCMIQAQKRNCFTTNDSKSPNTPCSFPFRFQGKLRRGCITEADPDRRHWCSTKTDQNLNHIAGQGYWGYCRRRNCPRSRSTNTTLNTPKPKPIQIPSSPTPKPQTPIQIQFPSPTRPSRPSLTNPSRNLQKDPSKGDYQPTEKEGTCGIPNAVGLIIGGKVTKRGELPFLAALGYKSGSGAMKYRCGGTLINRYSRPSL